jgi:hypothetical protein
MQITINQNKFSSSSLNKLKEDENNNYSSHTKFSHIESIVDETQSIEVQNDMVNF